MFCLTRSLVKVALFGWLIVAGAARVQAQTADDLYKQADQLEHAFKEEDAYAKCQQALKIQPDNLAALIKGADLACRIGARQAKKDAQKSYYTDGKAYIGRALKIDSNSSEANCVMAVALGRLALVSSTKEKVAMVKQIKAYADKSIQLNANNYKAYHVLGKWYYEVSNLNSFERMAAKVLYGSLPEATLADAIKAFEKSRSLNPGLLLNYFELARCYKDNDQNEKAIAALQTLLKLPQKMQDDAAVKADAQKMLNELM